jgi:hypothetical protein
MVPVRASKVPVMYGCPWMDSTTDTHIASLQRQNTDNTTCGDEPVINHKEGIIIIISERVRMDISLSLASHNRPELATVGYL